jgi:NitT/TauT family transport system substrate-binding protein
MKVKYEMIAVALIIIIAVIWGYTLVKQEEQPETKQFEIHLAYQFGFHYGQHIIMDHFDLIEKYSGGTITAKFTKISGGSTINEAIITGNIDFASMSAAAAIEGMDRGVPTKILISMGMKVAEIWTWREDIQSIEDFREGDIVASVKLGSVQYVSLTKAYLDIGRTREQAEAIMGFFSHADALQLMIQKEIDAAFSGPPYTTEYEKMGYHKVADEITIWGTSLPGSVLIGRVEFCNEHPDAIAAVLMAWLEATEYITSNPKEASAIIGEAYEYKAIEAWELWKEASLEWNPTFGLTALEELSSIMYELGFTSNNLKFEDICFEQTLGLIGR